MNSRLRKPLLLVLAVIVTLAMIRLGFWQLSRAAEKQTILDQQIALTRSSPQSLQAMVKGELIRFMPTFVSGRYIAEQTVLIDNQVLDSKVGYLVFTPMRVEGTEYSVMVNRGWLSVGDDRSVLPEFSTESANHQIQGRLNTPPAQPPLWNEELSVSQGAVWQYMPIDQLAEQMNLNLLPLVLELSPEFDGELEPLLKRRWRKIDDKWVATHHGYAFQWFAMALVFFIACVMLAVRSTRNNILD